MNRISITAAVVLTVATLAGVNAASDSATSTTQAAKTTGAVGGKLRTVAADSATTGPKAENDPSLCVP